jgi:hypothetical protein
VATNDVVVVLPWDPATATPYFTRINSASSSARAMTGIPLLSASTSSGLSGLMALEYTTTSLPTTFAARCPS